MYPGPTLDEIEHAGSRRSVTATLKNQPAYIVRAINKRRVESGLDPVDTTGIPTHELDGITAARAAAAKARCELRLLRKGLSAAAAETIAARRYA